MSKHSRVNYFEAWRGIAILMVIAIHTYNNTDVSAGLAIRQLFNCAVPVFFAISGFFLHKKTFDSKNDAASFWRKQIPKVYIPTILWSLPLFFLSISNGKPWCYMALLLLTCGISVYYFVAVIIQFYLLLPIFKRYSLWHGLGGVILSSVISLAMVTLVTYYNIVLSMHLPLIIYAGSCLLWVVFFIIGCYMSHVSRNYSLWIPLFVAMTGFIGSYIEGHFLILNYGSGAGIKPSSFIFSIAMCFVMFSSRLEQIYDNCHVKLFKALEYIGSISFAVYLLHMYVKSFILPKIPLVSEYWFLRWLIVFMVSVMIVELIKRTVPSRYHSYIGIYD